LSRKATAYISSVIGLGLAAFATALYHWEIPDTFRFLTYLILATLGGSRKIRLPGMTGTYSMSFVFVLLGIQDFTYTQTLLIGCASMLAQCLWKPQRPPTAVQVIFNVGCLAASAGATYYTVHALLPSVPILLSLTLAAAVYFTTNTLLVCGVLTLVEQTPFVTAWNKWLALSFPYYVVGVAIVGLILVTSQQVAWPLPLLALPLLYLAHACQRAAVERLRQTAS